MDTKKQAAVMAAVTAYMTDADALAGQGADLAEIGSERCGRGVLPGPGLNIWSLAGRQVMMQANTMMQLRIFK